VTTEKSMPNILMLISLTAEDPRFDQQFLGNYSLINIKDILARIKGIGRVNVLGASDYSMRIWIKPDRLAHLGISVPEIVDAIRAQSVVVPGGKFGAEPAPPGTEFTYTVRLPDRLQNAEEFGEIVVGPRENGSQVKLKHIARVELGVETYNAFTRMNGKPCAMIALYQAPGSNAVALAEQVKTTMADLARSFPKSMRYDISLDTTTAITAGIDEIIETLFIALALVILVVFIFIQDWRATLIPTIAIPVSLLATFMAFPMIGFTINVLSLLGLVLAIGIVVDDAIVVVEAVQVKIEEGMTPKEATKAAMKEVTAPVIATTLVHGGDLHPGGGHGRHHRPALPAVCHHRGRIGGFFLHQRPDPQPGPVRYSAAQAAAHARSFGAFFRLFNSVFDKTTSAYTGFTRIVTRRIAIGLAFMIILTGGLVFLGKLVPGGFMPSEDMGYLMVNIQLPDAASMQRTDEITKRLRKSSRITRRSNTLRPWPDSACSPTACHPMPVSFSSRSRIGACGSRTANQLVAALNREFFMGVNEAQVFAFGPPAIPGLGSGSGFTMMIQDRAGNTPAYLAEQTTRFAQAATARPEIASVVTTFRPSVPQRFMEINRDKVLKAGVALNDIYTTVGAFLGDPTSTTSTASDGSTKPTSRPSPSTASARIASTSFSSKTRTATGCP
jgi:HAE1 family hydrophobic/amphiphilic exporter-1